MSDTADSPVSGDRSPNPTFKEQLVLLHALMKETSATANQFAGRFIFGGLVAVVALLNADLVLLRSPVELSWGKLPLLAIIIAAVIGLSYIYFRAVTRQYNGFRQSHRKLKYKFELTLHAMLTDAAPSEYARRLEDGVDKEPTGPKSPPYPAIDSPSFPEVADYLLEHHRHRFAERAADRSQGLVWIAMLLVVITLVIRLLGLALAA